MAVSTLALVVAAALPLAARAEVTGSTTLQTRLAGAPPEQGFAFLREAPGEGHVVRTELAPAQAGRDARRRSLLYFAQLSDFQLSDEESPARVEFLDRDPSGFATAAWRPQEAMVALQVEHTVRQINRFLDSPVAQGDGSRAKLANAILTGDLADSQQRNETEWVLRLLEGGPIDPGSGTKDVEHPLCPPGGAGVRDLDDPRRYTGVQDYGDYAVPDTIIYDPADPRGVYAERNWPTYPGLMDRAQRPFTAEGLKVPSYVAFGNHDALVQGNEDANASFELIATGCVKPLTSLGDPNDPFGSVSDPGMLLARAIAEPDKFMLVPRDANRRYVDKREYKQVFRTQVQPDGHGFAYVDPAEQQASAGAAGYYSFAPRTGLRYIALDTVAEGGVVGRTDNGNLDDGQFRWLERELAAAQRRNEVVVVFGHHGIGSLVANVPDELAPPCASAERDPNPGCDRDPRPSTPVHLGPDVEALLLRFPNVVALVAGHSHENRILAHPRQGGGGFWEVKTAAIVDWSSQQRLVEVMDNRDGTLSLFGTLVDHAGPAAAPPGANAASFSDEQVAALGRTLSYNDPQGGPSPGGATPGPGGAPTDRNVELLVRDPRRVQPTPDDDEDAPRPSRDTEDDDDGDPDQGGGADGDDEAPRATARDTAGGDDSLPFTGGALIAVALTGAALLAAGLATRARRS
jgi:metallophosphoesterase (TIGR03767 family)